MGKASSERPRAWWRSKRLSQILRFWKPGHTSLQHTNSRTLDLRILLHPSSARGSLQKSQVCMPAALLCMGLSICKRRPCSLAASPTLSLSFPLRYTQDWAPWTPCTPHSPVSASDCWSQYLWVVGCSRSEPARSWAPWTLLFSFIQRWEVGLTGEIHTLWDRKPTHTEEDPSPCDDSLLPPTTDSWQHTSAYTPNLAPTSRYCSEPWEPALAATSWNFYYYLFIYRNPIACVSLHVILIPQILGFWNCSFCYGFTQPWTVMLGAGGWSDQDPWNVHFMRHSVGSGCVPANPLRQGCRRELVGLKMFLF